MTTTFVDFKHGGKEFVVQTVFAKGKDDAGIIFTSGSQSWATAVRPANKSRATALTDEEFLETVVASLVSQDRAVYDFDVGDQGLWRDVLEVRCASFANHRSRKPGTRNRCI
jgi:hypothetical protein